MENAAADSKAGEPAPIDKDAQEFAWLVDGAMQWIRYDPYKDEQFDRVEHKSPNLPAAPTHSVLFLARLIDHELKLITFRDELDLEHFRPTGIDRHDLALRERARRSLRRNCTCQRCPHGIIELSRETVIVFCACFCACADARL